MKTPNKKQKNNERYSPYKKDTTDIKDQTTKTTKPCLLSYSQACLILKAIETNDRKKLSKKCLAYLAVFVSKSWEEKVCKETIQKVYYMMNNLLDTTCMDITEPFEVSILKFCSNTVSTPTICPSVTLLIAISYIERLNKRYKNLKGTSGCAIRMIMVAYIMASKYIHDSLQLIIYTNKDNNELSTPKKLYTISSQSQSIQSIFNQLDQLHKKKLNSIHCTDTTTANNSQNDTISNQKDETLTEVTPASTDTIVKTRNIRIARMELELLHFLNYDLSVQDPIKWVLWAHSLDFPTTIEKSKQEEDTSADEGDDEMDDDI